MTTTVHHARPGRLRDWLPRRRQRTGPAVHGVRRGEERQPDYIITGSHAVPAPDLVQRTVPASVKTTPATGSTVGYDTEPWSMDLAEGFAGRSVLDQPQRVPGSSGLQPLVPVEPLADAGLLGRTLDGLKALPDTPPAPVHTGVSLAGLPDDVHPLVPDAPEAAQEQSAAPGDWPTYLLAHNGETRQFYRRESLDGAPAFFGLRDYDGVPVARLKLGDDDGDSFIINAPHAAYLVALRAALDEAISALTMGSPVVEQTGGAQ